MYFSQMDLWTRIFDFNLLWRFLRAFELDILKIFSISIHKSLAVLESALTVLLTLGEADGSRQRIIVAPALSLDSAHLKRGVSEAVSDLSVKHFGERTITRESDLDFAFPLPVGSSFVELR